MKLLFVSFGQFAGTPFYYHLARILRESGHHVEMVTDRRSAMRLDGEERLRALPVHQIAFSSSSIREFVGSRAGKDLFVLFSSILFALPCRDLLCACRYSIQSTVFFRQSWAETIGQFSGVDTELLITRYAWKDLLELPTLKMAEIETICDRFVFPCYSYLYSMDAEGTNVRESAKMEWGIGRPSFYRTVCSISLLLSVEKAVLKDSVKLYSFYGEMHKLESIRRHYPEFACKTSALVPGIEVAEDDSISSAAAVSRRMSDRRVLFFCGEREFSYWEGEKAVEILSLLPDDVTMRVLGRIPDDYIQGVTPTLLARIEHGIVDRFEEVTAIFSGSSVLLAMKRQLVSYSVLEAMAFGLPCIFSRLILSYGHGVMDRLESAAGVHVVEDTVEGYAEAILRLLSDRQAYAGCVRRQTEFLRTRRNIRTTAQQLERDLESPL